MRIESNVMTGNVAYLQPQEEEHEDEEESDSDTDFEDDEEDGDGVTKRRQSSKGARKEAPVDWWTEFRALIPGTKEYEEEQRILKDMSEDASMNIEVRPFIWRSHLGISYNEHVCALSYLYNLTRM